MAKIVIEIEDKPGNKVMIKATPNFEQMAKMDISGHGLTSAQGYAIAMLNKAREIGKSNNPSNKVLLPRIGRS